MAELLTQHLWLQSSILQCWSAHSHTQKHMLNPLLCLYLRGCLTSQIECVSDIRLTCFLCSGLSLQRHGNQKSSFDWIDAAGSELRAWLTDGWADYNALQHVSNMLATQWAIFQKPRISYCMAPTLPLPTALEQTLTSNPIIREPGRRIDCRGVFCSSPRHRKRPLGLWRQGYSEGGFCFG